MYHTRPQYYYPPAPSIAPLSAAMFSPLGEPAPWKGHRQRKTSSTSLETVDRIERNIPASSSRKISSGGFFPIPELEDGVDYFKIGDSVRIRRWNASTDSYSGWYVGQVMRPILIENEDGSQRRNYVVSFANPRTKEPQEKMFSPFFKEIAPLECAGDGVSSLRDEFSSGRQIVLAPLPVARSVASGSTGSTKEVVYTPAAVLTAPDDHGRVRLRVLEGPAADREFDHFAIKYARPYSAQTVQELRKKGHKVEGDGWTRF